MQVKKSLAVLIEGGRDEKFVNSIVEPILVGKNKYDELSTYKYARRPKAEIIKYISTVTFLGEDVLCLTDFDNAPCISGRKQKLKLDHVGDLEDSKIIVVIKEIESWYMAGLSDRCCRRMGIRTVKRTDTMNKEQFHAEISRSKYQRRINCVLEMLRNFEVSVALRKNKSFHYFYDKYLN